MNSEENKDRIANVNVNVSDNEEWMNSVDYAIILAYLEKFGEFLFDKSIKIKTLESNLTDSNRCKLILIIEIIKNPKLKDVCFCLFSVRRKLKNFHFKLMRRLNSGKSMKRHKLETYLSKVSDYKSPDRYKIDEIY